MFSVQPSYRAEYAPFKPSPLSPKNSNARPHVFPLSPPLSPPSRTSRVKLPFSKRPIKSNPLLHSTEHGRERQRNLFLKKVREEGADRQWKARGGDEEITRRIYLSERKRWEAAQAQIARELPALQEDDEDMGFNSFEDSRMVDDPMSEENIELEALVSLLESPDPVDNRDSISAQPNSFSSCSEDEEYDRLFLDLISQECSHQERETSGVELEDMDISSS
ncbi:hypothetical protein GP486_000656 [Trichoglossum hirsutum]|uniref:Uncharacterized protein n=1 Tax=Trichoglossum hirsutum TaxID=265104 RepID=A0A9P8RTC2_9PEZI|nr:hypothetical protein GP486_000656 [Trichoglossum hirsutum]